MPRNAGAPLSIISGQFKGLKLASPGGPTHPMGAREKNALFNILQPWLAGAIVLDAYAGSGALGLEALSRGAASVTFVENHPQAIRTIRQNLTKIVPNSSQTALFPENIAKFAQNPRLEAHFSLILADPPYDGFQLAEVAQIAKMLQKDGILALSYPSKLGELEIPGLERLTTRHYAAAGIGIYRKKL